MKKNIKTTLIALFALLPLGMQAQQSIDFSEYEGTQIPNSDFETWADDEGNTKVEPRYWHSFESASGNLASRATGKISSSGTSKGGNYSCQLKSSSIIGIVANGTMTTGQLNAGSMSATNTDNHASLDISSTSKDNYGDPFYAELTARPAALAVWVKFSQGTANADHPYATVSAAITNGNYYQEPTANKDSSVVIGYAKNNEIASNGGEWQHLYVPFRYDSNNYNKEDEPKAIMVTLSTNADAGKGSGGDILLIDDLELIYTQQVTIPESGYTTFTNIAQKNHKVVMPEGIKGYALGIAPDGNLCIKKTYLKGDAIPAMASLLLVGNEGDYTFSTTLYQNCDVPALDDDAKLVQGSELNTPVEGYTYYAWHDEEGHTGFFLPERSDLKIQESEALLRVKAGKAADSYQHILFTPELTGDINDDGQQSIADITALVNRLLGKQEQSSKLFIPSADVNGDSSTTIADVTALVNILLGKGN